MILPEFTITTRRSKVRCVRCNKYIANATTHICKISSTNGWLGKEDGIEMQNVRFENAKKMIRIRDALIWRLITTAHEYEQWKHAPATRIDRNGALHVEVADKSGIDDDWIRHAISHVTEPYIPDENRTPPHYWDLDF